MTEQELLAVKELISEEQQIKRLYELGYTDCFVKLDCGRDGVKYECKTGSLADLAFKKNNGKIAGKKPIEHIIDVLAKEMK